MENTTFNQTLIDIEENLNKLENARTQVNNVSEKSELIIHSFTNILKQIEKLNLGFEENENRMLGSISESVNRFNDNIEEKADSFSKKIGTLNYKLESEIDVTIVKLAKLQDEVIAKIESVSNVNFDEGLKVLSDQINDLYKGITEFKVSLNKDISAIKDENKLLTQEQKTNTTLIIQSINNSNKNVSSLADSLNKVINQIETLNNKTTNFEEKFDDVSRRSTLFISIGIFTIIGVEMLLKAGVFNALFRMLK